MKKNIVVTIILGILAISGIFIVTGKREIDTQTKGQENLEFDYEKSFDVIKEELNCEDVKVDIILKKLMRSNVESVTSAELVEEEKKGKDVILEIKGESNKKFRVYMSKSYRVYAIKDMESGEYVYAAIK